MDKSQTLKPNTGSVTIDGLTGGSEYSIELVAFNDWGTSAPVSTTVLIPYVAFATQTVSITLTQQAGDEQSFPYAGKYPGLGVATGNLEKITVPVNANGPVTIINFLKINHSSDDCYDSSAVVAINVGSSTTTADLTAIYGSAKPPYSSENPIGFVACALKPVNSTVSFPTTLSIELTLQPSA